jgi:dipeptidyl aminopeptidase/acylaminoacyl peptidase
MGAGWQQWLKNSPLFNMDKVNAPLRVVATRDGSLFEMWEPYALLERMHKPVDLVVLNTEEHVLTNPTIRLVAQTGTVDWFRFWLQSFEDSDPAKKEQYARWRVMREHQNLAQE